MSEESSFLPTTYLTVLTLIGRGARYGYEINEIIVKHGYRQWVDLKFSSIYKALNQLESKELVKGTKEDESIKGSKKVYSLTRKGRSVLKSQVRQCLSNPPRTFTLFDLGISAMSILSKEEALDALETYRQNLIHSTDFLSAQVDAIHNIEEIREKYPNARIGQQSAEEFEAGEEQEVVVALFERPLRALESQVEWLDEFIKRIRAGSGFTFSEPKKKR